MIVKINRPVQLNGKELTEIDLKLEDLRGNDIIEIDTGFKQLYKGEFVPVSSIDLRFQVLVAGRVSGFNPQDLGQLYAPDFMNVCSTVQNFLLTSGLEELTKSLQQKSSEG